MNLHLHKPLNELKEEWSERIVESIPETLALLKEALPKASEKYEAVLLLEAQFNEINKQRIKNLITEEAKTVGYSNIRQNLLDLIDGLTEGDFKPKEAKGPDVKPITEQEGCVLYRIPDTMPRGKESKCIVRISYDEDKIIENIELDEHIELKSIRVSDHMAVELFDPSAISHFQIRSINSTKQFIEVGENTEWIFYVQPHQDLEEGTYPLVLKVSIIEIIDGEKIPREIVLEEQVRIVVDGEVEVAEAHLQMVKDPGMAKGLAFSTATGVSPMPRSQPPAQPAVQQPARKRRSQLPKILSVLLVVVASTWAVVFYSGGGDLRNPSPAEVDLKDSTQQEDSTLPAEEQADTSKILIDSVR